LISFRLERETAADRAAKIFPAKSWPSLSVF
jgi:hypothetical protein